MKRADADEQDGNTTTTPTTSSSSSGGSSSSSSAATEGGAETVSVTWRIFAHAVYDEADVLAIELNTTTTTATTAVHTPRGQYPQQQPQPQYRQHQHQQRQPQPQPQRQAAISAAPPAAWRFVPSPFSRPAWQSSCKGLPPNPPPLPAVVAADGATVVTQRHLRGTEHATAFHLYTSTVIGRPASAPPPAATPPPPPPPPPPAAPAAPAPAAGYQRALTTAMVLAPHHGLSRAARQSTHTAMAIRKKWRLYSCILLRREVTSQSEYQARGTKDRQPERVYLRLLVLHHHSVIIRR